ncbi:MAG: AbrB/MazE/SpoVT family DNA-binding domain-containing protein [Robiginitomaculum sp.]|nr:MAG: AbrB/MazE/SpoVT family DNA-binding domain-containing protein [Robiginitomaculum sp.]
MSSTAKIFMTGRSQAVRLPKEFRFEGSQVKIRREGNAVVLEPMSSDWAWLDALPDTVDSDFVDSVLDRPTKQQDRPDLEFFE